MINFTERDFFDNEIANNWRRTEIFTEALDLSVLWSQDGGKRDVI